MCLCMYLFVYLFVILLYEWFTILIPSHFNYSQNIQLFFFFISYDTNVEIKCFSTESSPKNYRYSCLFCLILIQIGILCSLFTNSMIRNLFIYFCYSICFFLLMRFFLSCIRLTIFFLFYKLVIFLDYPFSIFHYFFTSSIFFSCNYVPENKYIPVILTFHR